MSFSAALGSLVTIYTTHSPGGSVGACAWANIDQQIRLAYLKSYEKDGIEASKVLSSADAVILSSVNACAGGADIPPHWARLAVASRAIQDGAASEVLAHHGVGRAELQRAWVAAPESARQAFVHNAAIAFGVDHGPIPPMAEAQWFTRRFNEPGLDEQVLDDDLLIFFNAVAMSEWAEALILKFES